MFHIISSQVGLLDWLHVCRLGELDPRPRDEAMLQLLAPPLIRQVMDHPEVGEQLRKLPCIPTASGALSAPEALFDPRNRQLAEALGSQAALPAEPFTSNQVWTIGCNAFVAVSASCCWRPACE